jgi:ubiquinone/menaquinone biosynthesis C-methylase UbiE
MRLSQYLSESEKEFWEDVYDEEESHWETKDVSRLTKAVIRKYKKFDKVLEIGSAAGIDTFYLAEYCKSIIGIDIVKDVVATANKNLKNQSKKIQARCSFQQGDAEKLVFDDGQFDFVYSLSVLHSTDLSISLAEVNRVLADDGHAVIYVFVGGDEGTDKDKFIELCDDIFTIDKTDDIIVKEDAGGDQHNACIVWLSKKG